MKPSHVLITRPEPQSADLAQRLQGLGVDILTLEVFQFRPGYPGVDFSSAWPHAVRRLAIFCSTRAVQFGLRQLPAGFLDGVEIAAIGPATARELERAGWTPTIVPESGFDSESLLGEEALAGRPGSALIFTAPGGREMLYQALLEREWKVQFAHVYRREPMALPASVRDALLASDGVISVWTSGSALQQVAGQMEPRAWSRVCAGAFVVVSERVADLAATFASGPIVVADGPGNVDLAAAVRALLDT